MTVVVRRRILIGGGVLAALFLVDTALVLVPQSAMTVMGRRDILQRP